MRIPISENYTIKENTLNYSGFFNKYLLWQSYYGICIWYEDGENQLF